jgi:hypothetical protein
MNQDIINEISKKINDNSINYDDEKILFSSSNYKSLRIVKENFHYFRREASSKKIAFIDGGDMVIFSNSSFSLHFVRTYGHIIQKNKTIKSLKSEFYILVNAKGTDDKIFYESQIIPVLGAVPKAISIDSMDNRIKDGVERASITKVCSIIRKSAELLLARDLLKHMGSGDMVVLDGTLEAKFELEEEQFNLLYNSAIEKNILITALSKSTNLLSSNGRTIQTVLLKNAPDNIWYYHPVVDINIKSHQAEMYFVKLHTKSKNIFRFEINKNQVKLVDPSKVLGFLAMNSRDLILPGYPYGLIKADKFARVSVNETQILKTRFNTKLKKEVRESLNLNNVHEVLDSIY